MADNIKLEENIHFEEEISVKVGKITVESISNENQSKLENILQKGKDLSEKQVQNAVATERGER
ncbi:MAG: hypothetical protein IJS61_08690 [Firmicutes bacterium]|nr:hypothetical protein [Bacillota bacterium]